MMDQTDRNIVVSAVKEVLQNMPPPEKSGGTKAWDAYVRVMSTLAVAAVLGLFNLNDRVTVLESTVAHESDLVGLERSLKVELPPQWLRDDLAEIKAAVQAIPDLVSRMARLEDRVELEHGKRK